MHADDSAHAAPRNRILVVDVFAELLRLDGKLTVRTIDRFNVSTNAIGVAPPYLVRGLIPLRTALLR